ncbi:hypothetical protein ACEUA0_21065 [Aeromonas veronii]
MMKDRRVLVYYFDDNSCDYIPHGLLSKLKDHSCSSNIDGHSFEKYKVEPKYKVNGILKRGITYDYDSGYDITTEEVNLNEFHACWTKRDLYELLKVEFEHQKDAIFRRPEYLDISLPYFIAILSLICFIFKYQILYLLAL